MVAPGGGVGRYAALRCLVRSSRPKSPSPNSALGRCFVTEMQEPLHDDCSASSTLQSKWRPVGFCFSKSRG
eukprot:3284216-Prymnesium_polylepis.1